MAAVNFLINFYKKALDEKSEMSTLFFLNSSYKSYWEDKKIITSREALNGSGFASLARFVGIKKRTIFGLKKILKKLKFLS